jgi:deazaflavin-dependent oxidoreductase (nitroreductase family)
VLDRPANSVIKLLARLPLLFYTLGRGRLLGHRFLVIVHTGRRSGRTYRTVVEVIGWDARRSEAIVASGWGEHANWYRNIEATPAAEILIAGERFLPRQRFLGTQERVDALRAYRREHPLAALVLARFLGAPVGQSGVLVMAERLPMVAFSPACGRGSRSD